MTARIDIHLAPDTQTYAAPGQIWVNSKLLETGRFSWGLVQHEYAHQVDFLLFDDATRTRLTAALGSTTWYQAGLHGDAGVERFASTLAWSYWPSPNNSMQPTSAGDESAALPPAAFRSLLASVLSPRSLASTG